MLSPDSTESESSGFARRGDMSSGSLTLRSSVTAYGVVQRIGSVDLHATEVDLRRSRLWVVWMITAAATVSVVSGLHYGIKALSQVTLALAAFLWTAVVWMDQTQFVLNAAVQTTGEYIQWPPKLAWRTDAFGQLKPGEGRFGDHTVDAADWMDDNTVFLWAWGIAWTPFVGLFLARISRGRTIREVCHYAIVVPVIVTILWFSVFGAAGIRQATRAGEVVLGHGAFKKDSGA